MKYPKLKELRALANSIETAAKYGMRTKVADEAIAVFDEVKEIVQKGEPEWVWDSIFVQDGRVRKAEAIANWYAGAREILEQVAPYIAKYLEIE